MAWVCGLRSAQCEYGLLDSIHHLTRIWRCGCFSVGGGGCSVDPDIEDLGRPENTLHCIVYGVCTGYLPIGNLL